MWCMRSVQNVLEGQSMRRGQVRPGGGQVRYTPRQSGASETPGV